VSVIPGWNWIAFASPTDLDSLTTVSHSAGFEIDDILKSSRAFSLWGTNGFVGSLTDLKVGNGYLLKCAKGGIVRFDSSSSRRRVSSVGTAVANTKAPSLPLVVAVGASTAALVISLEIEGAARTSGRISAFSSAGVLLGVQTAHMNGEFYLSVASPHESTTKGVASPDGICHFTHTDDDGVTRTLDKTYQFEDNDVVDLQLRDTPAASTPTPPKAAIISNVTSKLSYASSKVAYAAVAFAVLGADSEAHYECAHMVPICRRTAADIWTIDLTAILTLT
jgi:hypothetical protein